MSNFMIKARDKKDGHIHDVACMDNYFGRREYGYIVDGGNVFTEAAFRAWYEPINDSNDEQTHG